MNIKDCFPLYCNNGKCEQPAYKMRDQYVHEKTVVMLYADGCRSHTIQERRSLRAPISEVLLQIVLHSMIALSIINNPLRLSHGCCRLI